MRPHVRIVLSIGAGLALGAGILFFPWKNTHPPAVAPVATPGRAVLPPGKAASPTTPANLHETIARGKATLEGIALNPTDCFAAPIVKKVGKGRKARTVSTPVTGMRRCVGDYMLAVADPSGAIETVEILEGRKAPDGYAVVVEDGAKRRGVNVPFDVRVPADRTVVGLKTAVFTQGGAEEAVYVPYSRALDVPELREAGLHYLEAQAEAALADLRVRGVKSHHFKGRLVADIVDVRHLVTLVLTEQAKSDVLFVKGDEEARTAMVNRTLTIIGANLDETSSYTRSRVGAAGLAQLMPKTYRGLAKAYPTAGLDHDLDARLDHGEAMKAMVLHADDEWHAARGDLRQRLVASPAERLLFLAGGYNAYAGTVTRAMAKCGSQWRDADCGRQIPDRNARVKKGQKRPTVFAPWLPTETQRYLVKYEWHRATLYPDEGALARR